MPGDLSIVWLGTLASLFAGLATGVGALAIFMVRTITHRLQDGMLAAAAGVMLAASFFSLLLPGLDYGETITGHTWAAALIVIFGVLSGAGALYLVHQKLPHQHFELGREGPDVSYIRGIWLFIIAITLHNFPEGMAVGVGFAGEDVRNGYILATGIGMQNIPEGLAVAFSLLAIDYSRLRAFGIALLTGLAEPIGGLFGATAVWLAEPVMPWTLGFAAGAMLFIISNEIIPETHHREWKIMSTFSLMGGFCVMMFLDATLG
ncbi:ZIP family metal transporter [Marinobacter oulmenensis]|uniref:ZIP family zinc transporter n=1 Tax=Marinobacter oulmenensis TaxID=643747 RepID=A0A840UA38_9GAMM|nr:ZIP family metal transporter [Marinobacter oulmenensis]MBB5321989.1 ZIP family zinc transporter [Marinobacter oulmenensis]